MSGGNAGRLAVIENHTPAGARATELDFGEMLRRANVLAKSGLVPKALQDKPEAIVLVGALGAELGIPFVTALSEIHVIEGRPSPSAQMRLALVRRAGHEAEFVESSDERAVIRGRRSERRGDPDGWVRVEWNMEQARRAGLTDRWVERWTKNSEGRNTKQVVVVGDRDGMFTVEERAHRGLPKDLPDWACKLIDAGEIKQKDNWVKYPADMLRARAASTLCRMAFSDVLAGLGVAPHTAEEIGFEVAQDVDEPPATEDDDVVDGEIVEQGEDPGPIPSVSSDDDEELAAFVRWKRAGKPRDENGDVIDVPADVPTIEPERGDNVGAQVVGGSTAPPSGPGPMNLKARAKAAGVTQAELLRKAIEFSAGRDLPAPSTLSELDEQVEADLVDWLGE